MRPNLLIIGKMGSGKDTIADYLVEESGFHKIAMADPLKEAAASVFPQAMASGNRNLRRTHLQLLGDIFRAHDINILNKAILYNITYKEMFPVVISDIRLVTELEFFITHGFIPVGIDISDENRHQRIYRRDGIYPDLKTTHHKTETEVDRMYEMINLFINNNGSFQELETSVDQLLNQLKSNPTLKIKSNSPQKIAL